jgi:hypothetical protein
LLKTKEHIAKDVFNKEQKINQEILETMFTEKEAINEDS